MIDRLDPSTYRFRKRASLWESRRLRSLVMLVVGLGSCWGGVALGWHETLVYLVPLLLIVLAIRRRSYGVMLLLLLGTPLTPPFVEGVMDYARGEGLLRTMEGRSAWTENVHPYWRCQGESGKRTVRAEAGFRWTVPYNAALKTCILLFGPMEGSYDGPYPTMDEAIAVTEDGLPFNYHMLMLGRFVVGEGIVTLAFNVGNDALDSLGGELPKDVATCIRYPFLCSLGKFTSPIVGHFAMFEDRVLVLRITMNEYEPGFSEGDDPYAYALIDRENGDLVAMYGDRVDAGGPFRRYRSQ